MRVLLLLAAGTAMAAPVVKWNNLPLSFEPGQPAEAGVSYLARSNGYTLYLGNGGMRLAGRAHSSLRTSFPGSNLSSHIDGEGLQPSVSNYFVGNDPSRWRTSVPNYDRVRYTNLYPGIDLIYYGREGHLEFDWIVSPGANPRNIRLQFEGADRLRIDSNGDLLILQGRSQYRFRKPLVYQEIARKRRTVAGSWTFDHKEAAFQLGTYSKLYSLVIDPPLIYSTYEGGSGGDYGNAVAVDKSGNTYITGIAGSTDFPTTSPFQGRLKGTEDVFVTKINARGSARVYSTYLGSGGPDEGNGIAVDSQGNVYVTGSAGFSDFPTKNPIQATWGGSGDAFLTKLNATGSALIYSTYLGGSSSDYGTAIALDSSGSAYITGVTFSTNFPTSHPLQSAKGAQQDAFVAKISADGSAWVYATYLGGNNVDQGYAIATDSSGNAYITGYTASTNFPVQSPLQGANAGSVNAFISKLNPAGSALVYSTYLGGNNLDYGTGIAVDSSGNAYLTGVAGSDDFPVVNAIQPRHGSHNVDDAFIAKFNPSGSALIYCTYLGGGSEDQAFALAIDPAGNAYVTGRTNSSDFPLANPIQATRVAFDIFVTEINANGSAYTFSTFLGGTASESGRGIAVDRVGNIHVVGETASTDFPVLHSIQSMNGGGANDAFVVLLGDHNPPAQQNAGIFRSGFFWLEEVDGNQQFNQPPDRAFAFGGVPGDIPIVGDWNGSGTTKVGVFRSSNGLFLLDYDGDGAFTSADKVYDLGLGTQPGDVPVVGDWNGDGRSKIGLFRSGFLWILDTNGNGVFDSGSDQVIAYGGVGGDVPIVGDWNGDGRSKLGIFRQGFYFLLDYNGNGAFDSSDKAFAFGGVAGDVPVVGDWNGDGRTKVGVFRSGFLWIVDANGNFQFDGTGPGQDLVFAFGGIAGDKPVAGSW